MRENSGEHGINDTAATGANQPQFVSSIDFKAGEVLLEKYKIIKLLGRGGMGSVYEVEHQNLQARFAMKFLDHNSANDAAWRRFEIEARATSRLDHPNLIKVYDFGTLPDGKPFFTMDLVEGDTLADILKRQGRLSLKQTVKLFTQVGFALIYAHSNNIIHRDIKPSNIILSGSDDDPENSLVKLVDFGIAKLTGQDGFNQQTLTRTGEIFGSPLYMSPEQCVGTGVDHRSDLYSLGCVLFEALTGAPPLVGDSALATMMKHQSEKPLSLKEASMGIEFPKRIEQIVERLLIKDVNQRYQSAELFTADLVGLESHQSAGSNHSAESTPTSLPRPTSSKDSEYTRRFLITTFVLLYLTGIGIGILAHQAKPLHFSTVASNTDHFGPADSEIRKSLGGKPFVTVTSTARAYEDEIKKEGFYSDGKMPTRTFHFPNFPIGEIGIEAPDNYIRDLTVQGFHGICFKPSLNFKAHAVLFRKFRPDDLHQLDLSNGATYADLAGDLAANANNVLPFITHLKELRLLVCADSAISPGASKCLNQLPKLKALSLERTKIDQAAVASLQRLLDLEILNLDAMPSVEKVINKICQSKKLKTLSVGDCNVTPSQLRNISKIKQLMLLNISRNPQIKDGCLGELPSSLGSLAAEGCSITEKSVDDLGRLKSLKKVVLDREPWSAEGVAKLHKLLPRTEVEWIGTAQR